MLISGAFRNVRKRPVLKALYRQRPLAFYPHNPDSVRMYRCNRIRYSGFAGLHRFLTAIQFALTDFQPALIGFQLFIQHPRNRKQQLIVTHLPALLLGFHITIPVNLKSYVSISIPQGRSEV